MYDPDPNPKNEEQAIARSHRIGQTREVRVLYFEAVADKPTDVAALNGSAPAPKLKLRIGGNREQSNIVGLSKDKKYVDSIESITRNVIQKGKMEMAEEIIDAGKFDLETTHDERQANLSELIHNAERVTLPENDIFTMSELNKALARSDAEYAMYEKVRRRRGRRENLARSWSNQSAWPFSDGQGPQHVARTPAIRQSR